MRFVFHRHNNTHDQYNRSLPTIIIIIRIAIIKLQLPFYFHDGGDDDAGDRNDDGDDGDGDDDANNDDNEKVANIHNNNVYVYA